MRRLLLVAVLAALALGLDQGLRLVAAGQLASRAREAARDPESAEATITSFPFVGRLLVSGGVPRVRVRVTGAAAGPLRLAAVEVEGSGVRVDRSALLSGAVRLEGIDRGSVTVELDSRAISEAVGVPVVVADGRMQVGTGAVKAGAGVEVDRDGSLVLRAAGLSGLRVPVARSPLVPCAATSVSVRGDRVRLRCDVDALPAPLRR